MPPKPEWWDWELELSPHLLKRMRDRAFDEVDLRVMLEAATVWSPSDTSGRFVIAARHSGRPWRIVVEPDEEDRLLVVITAYPVT